MQHSEASEINISTFSLHPHSGLVTAESQAAAVVTFPSLAGELLQAAGDTKKKKKKKIKCKFVSMSEQSKQTK